MFRISNKYNWSDEMEMDITPYRYRLYALQTQSIGSFCNSLLYPVYFIMVLNAFHCCFYSDNGKSSNNTVTKGLQVQFGVDFAVKM